MHSETSLSSLTGKEARAWRAFIECAWALVDILDTELQAVVGVLEMHEHVVPAQREVALGLQLGVQDVEERPCALDERPPRDGFFSCEA